MKKLLAFTLTLTTLSGYAQQAPLNRELPFLPRTHADSAEVIHRAFQYFRHRERKGLILASAAGSAQVVGMLTSSTASTPLRTTLTSTSAVIYAGLLADYIVTLTKFSKRRETATLRRFELRQPQPTPVQRMLTAYVTGKRKF